jgi:hypothetical protein
MSARFTTTLDRRLPFRGRSRRTRFAGILAGFLWAAVFTGTVAYAVITATAPGTSVVSTGKLSLTLTNSGVGFSTPVADLVPTDTVHRYVDLLTGTAQGKDITLTVTSSASNKLTTDATNGLQLTVSSCSGSWNAVSGVCTGTVSPLVATAPLSGLTGVTTTLVPGTIAAGTTAHLRVTLTLPNQTETTVNGTLPANSIQSLSTTLTYTFAMTQRDGVTSSS